MQFFGLLMINVAEEWPGLEPPAFSAYITALPNQARGAPAQ
jgi:hypothetical protein